MVTFAMSDFTDPKCSTLIENEGYDSSEIEIFIADMWI